MIDNKRSLFALLHFYLDDQAPSHEFGIPDSQPKPETNSEWKPQKIDCIKHNPFLSGCRLRCKLLVSGMVQELLTDSSVEYYTELPNTISARGTSATSSPGTMLNSFHFTQRIMRFQCDPKIFPLCSRHFKTTPKKKNISAPTSFLRKSSRHAFFFLHNFGSSR